MFSGIIPFRPSCYSNHKNAETTIDRPALSQHLRELTGTQDTPTIRDTLFVSLHLLRCPDSRATADMGLNAQQFPQPLGTDEGCVRFADRAPANRVLTS